MTLHPLAGQTAPSSHLVNIPRLIADYYLLKPDVINQPSQQVCFGTSGHRGCSTDITFNEEHLLAISQAICEKRRIDGITGPLFLGMDTHALSEPAFCSVVEVLVGNGVQVVVQQDRGYTPTPVISHAILTFNKQTNECLSDGIVITPSHNPPEDGGLKYNCADGGPANTEVTGWIQQRANALLESGLKEVKRIDFNTALDSALVSERDFAVAYVDELDSIIDMQAIRRGAIKIGIDPLGGSGIYYWDLIAKKYDLDIEVVNDAIDPTFSFMSIDKDGKIRMDCSSQYAMTRLIGMKDKFDIAIGNDPDYDRHGIVTKKGLLDSNHYLAVAVHYLLEHRSNWSSEIKVGKSLVATSMIDRVAKAANRDIYEVPVGFKWYVKGINDGTLGFVGEESAGASFVKKDGSVWGTDKDGIIMGLLAAEIMAVTGKDPEMLFGDLCDQFGKPYYKRIDAPATAEQKAKLKKLDSAAIKATTIAGEPIIAVYTHAPGNDRAIGGVKVVTENGWFAARPSGTEPLYKIYLESFKGLEHLALLEAQAKQVVAKALR